MKLDPGMHIGMHLVFFGKAGVTQGSTSKEANDHLHARRRGRDRPSLE
jgi:hypothetical protein